MCICALTVPCSYASEEKNTDANFEFAQNIGLIGTDTDGGSLITRYELASIVSDIIMHGENTSSAEDS